MNYMWRVSKYNPINRDDMGAYLLDEWTSFSDIGKSYQGVKLTISEYEKSQKLYNDAILRFMECNEVENLRVTDLEKYDYENVDKVINNIKEAYPNGQFVEFHITGLEPKYEGIDWRSLKLVFEDVNGTLYLVGIIHSEWTI